MNSRLQDVTDFRQVGGVGPIRVRQPRVRHRDKGRFSSAILPKYMRRAPSVDALLPALYLKGISTGDFSEALAPILGEGASGLSATNIVRLKAAVGNRTRHPGPSQNRRGVVEIGVVAAGAHGSRNRADEPCFARGGSTSQTPSEEQLIFNWPELRPIHRCGNRSARFDPSSGQHVIKKNSSNQPRLELSSSILFRRSPSNRSQRCYGGKSMLRASNHVSVNIGWRTPAYCKARLYTHN
jgi:hypothetical protein